VMTRERFEHETFPMEGNEPRH